MYTPQHTWSRKGGAARQGVVWPLLATSLLGLTPWSEGGLRADEGCRSYTFLQSTGPPISTGLDTKSVATGDCNRNGNSRLAMSRRPRVLSIRPTGERSKSVPSGRDATQARVGSRQTGETTMKTKIQQRGCLVMMTLRTLPAVALGLLLLLGVPGLARAQYDFTPIDVPKAAATYANGNSTHEIVGEFDDEDGNTHGFVLSKGAFTQFDAPGADGYTSVNGINGKGDRSGIYFANDRFYGYFWSKGNFITLDPPGSTFSVAEFLNAHGQVVGYSRHDLGPVTASSGARASSPPSTCLARDHAGPGSSGSTNRGRL